MDQANPFESRNTYRLHRGEYLLWLAIVTGLFAYHIRDVRWLPAVALFLYIDLVGYIPGAIAYHRSSTKHISKVYYVLYNTMHSMITQTVVVGLWGLTIGWEWALLIVPFTSSVIARCSAISSSRSHSTSNPSRSSSSRRSAPR